MFFFPHEILREFLGEAGGGAFFGRHSGTGRSRGAPGSVPDVAADKSSASGRFGARPLTDSGCRPTGIDTLPGKHTKSY